jgi:hypothetical protein
MFKTPAPIILSGTGGHALTLDANRDVSMNGFSAIARC